MIQFLDNLNEFISNIIPYAFVIGFFGMLAHIFKKGKIRIKNRVINIGLILGITVITLFMVELGTRSIIHARARVELKGFLTQANLTVKKNGNEIDGILGKQIITDLKTIRYVMAHNSSESDEILFTIYSKKDSINLTLKKDADRKTEYWIYWKKYKATNDIRVGAISTSILLK